jgi:hypothetical protein
MRMKYVVTCFSFAAICVKIYDIELLFITLSILVMWHSICNVCKRPINKTEKEHITLIRATHLTAKEIVMRVSMIQEEKLRVALAEQVNNYLQTSTRTKCLNVTINSRGANEPNGNYYASCYIKLINNEKYDMHLAYFYSTSVYNSEDVSFDRLHQRMKMEWPELLEFIDETHMTQS